MCHWFIQGRARKFTLALMFFHIIYLFYSFIYLQRFGVCALVKSAKQYKFNVAAKLEMTLSGDIQ